MALTYGLDSGADVTIRRVVPEDVEALHGLELDPRLFGKYEAAILSQPFDHDDFQWYERNLGGLMIGAFVGDVAEAVAGVKRSAFREACMRIAFRESVDSDVLSPLVSEAEATAHDELPRSDLILLVAQTQPDLAEVATELGYKHMASHGNGGFLRRFPMK